MWHYVAQILRSGMITISPSYPSCKVMDGPASATRPTPRHQTLPKAPRSLSVLWSIVVPAVHVVPAATTCAKPFHVLVVIRTGHLLNCSVCRCNNYFQYL